MGQRSRLRQEKPPRKKIKNIPLPDQSSPAGCFAVSLFGLVLLIVIVWGLLQPAPEVEQPSVQDMETLIAEGYAVYGEDDDAVQAHAAQIGSLLSEYEMPDALKAEAYAFVALSRLDLRDWNGALHYATTAIGLNPELYYAYFLRCIALDELGQTPAAKVDCTLALANAEEGWRNGVLERLNELNRTP